MVMPGENRIEIPLLIELQKAGGSAKPSELYPAVAAHFPGLTKEDLTRRLPCGAKAWWNRVQWTRQRLVDKGELDPSVHGVWAITEAGRARLKQAPDVKTRQVQPPLKREKKSTKRVDHDGLARAIEKIGQAFGFQTRWKPKVNDLRPAGARIKSKRKTLDVAWQIAGLAWVPVEVQVGGSVADLIYRFNQVQQWSIRLVVVTVERYREELEEAVYGYSFPDKVVILDADDVLAATHSLDRLLALRRKIFESPE